MIASTINYSNNGGNLSRFPLLCNFGWLSPILKDHGDRRGFQCQVLTTKILAAGGVIGHIPFKVYAIVAMFTYAPESRSR